MFDLGQYESNNDSWVLLNSNIGKSIEESLLTFRLKQQVFFPDKKFVS